ncbi:MAG TPA: STAS domain-containing protein [Nitrosomonas sp.]|nr:STAS domain-containing protein [Nitrosomonas sp.]
MVYLEDQKIIVQGPATVDNITALTKQGFPLLSGANCTVDLSQVTEVDSTILSMFLEWLRAARQTSCQIKFINMPSSVASLIQLYGITELIPTEKDSLEAWTITS